ncbi:MULTISPECIES: virulence factor TspB C-terminal domain-related protein [unclassified Acinetobacter]|uniref:virulence factor TspB C-terminal domain-related protein n=1 Tax=unclassified Acinetobacter TaxID=196816 RepID=UPI00124F98E4|nr:MULTISPECIES: virulence factor TspB C-terminal domain-related protein [unclassified Acinetobacter]
MRILFAFLFILFCQFAHSEECFSPIWAPLNEADCKKSNFIWSEGAKGCYSKVPSKCPEPWEPQCVEGAERVADSTGNFFACMTPCPAGKNRTYWASGEPQDNCELPPCHQGYQRDSESEQCIPIQCHDKRYDLVETPFNHCRLKCAPQEERSFEKYNDLNCYLSPCPDGLKRDHDNIIGYGTDKPEFYSDGYPQYLQCVKPETPKPEEKTCDSSVTAAVNCFRESVVKKLSDFGNNSDSSLKNILTNLGLISSKLDSNPNNHNPDSGHENVDTSPLNAFVSPVDIKSNVIDQSIFTSNSQCPPDRKFVMWGFTYDFKFGMLCDALHKLGFLVMFIALILSAYIISRE